MHFITANSSRNLLLFAGTPLFFNQSFKLLFAVLPLLTESKGSLLLSVICVSIISLKSSIFIIAHISFSCLNTKTPGREKI